MPIGDDIVLGESARLIDSDGDGVSDAQEKLEGTDPGDASDHLLRDPTLKPDVGDFRGDLDRPNLDREVAFDKGANVPEGMSINTGLTGLTNLGGSALPTGTNHHGIGEDTILQGRLGTNPLDMNPDPLGGLPGSTGPTAPTPGTGVITSPGGSSDGGFTDSVGGAMHRDGPPPGQGPSGSADPGNNPDLVGWTAEGAANAAGKAVRDVINTPGRVIDKAENMYDAFVQGLTEPTDVPDPPKPDPPPDPPNPPKSSVDPDADLGGGDGTPKVHVEPRVVEGFGATHIEGDTPPVKYIDLVTNSGDGSVDTLGETGTLRGAPDAPVIHTVNPDLAIDRPPTGSPPPGGDGGVDDDFGLLGTSSAATAASADAGSAPGISLVGAGSGPGISSVAPTGATDDLVSGVRDPSISPTGHGAQHSAPDGGIAAVDQFATEYLADDSLSAPTALGESLSANLDDDLAPRHDDFQAPIQDDPSAGPPPDGLGALGDDDPFDN